MSRFGRSAREQDPTTSGMTKKGAVSAEPGDTDEPAPVDRDPAAAAQEARRDTVGNSPEDGGRPGGEVAFRDGTNPMGPTSPGGSGGGSTGSAGQGSPPSHGDVLANALEERAGRNPEDFYDPRAEARDAANSALSDLASAGAQDVGGGMRSGSLVSDGNKPENKPSWLERIFPNVGTGSGTGYKEGEGVKAGANTGQLGAANPRLEAASKELSGYNRIERALEDDPAPTPTPTPTPPSPDDAFTAVSSVVSPGGSTRTTYKDGTVVTTHPDGTTHTKRADGTVEIRRPDGSTTTQDPDGNITETPATQPAPAPAGDTGGGTGQPDDEQAFRLSPEKQAIVDGAIARLAARGGGGDGRTDPVRTGDEFVAGGTVPDDRGDLLTGDDRRGEDVRTTGGANSDGPDFNGGAGAINPGPDGSAPSGGGRSEDPFDRTRPNVEDHGRITAPDQPESTPLVDVERADVGAFGTGATRLHDLADARPDGLAADLAARWWDPNVADIGPGDPDEPPADDIAGEPDVIPGPSTEPDVPPEEPTAELPEEPGEDPGPP